MKNLFLLYNYLIYRVKSKNEHGVHSPFVFDLLMTVLYNKKPYYAYKQIEDLRAQLIFSKKQLNCFDLGAGSRVNNRTQKTVNQIVLSAAKPPKYAQLLFRLINHFQPNTILELGTSLGVTTAYMAAANTKSKVITIEGCEEVAYVAQQNFNQLELSTIKSVIGNFDVVLPQVLNEIKVVDFVFFDGNHQYVPTIRYFHQCLEKATDQSVFVFDDIYWSDEMKSAWLEIKAHPKVTVTIDLFYLGIVFFRKEQAKEHFVISF